MKSLVMIYWEDSRVPINRWERLADYESEGITDCISVGFLIYDGPEYKTIAPTIGDIEDGEDLQALGIMQIPTRCITGIKLLKSYNGVPEEL